MIGKTHEIWSGEKIPRLDNSRAHYYAILAIGVLALSLRFFYLYQVVDTAIFQGLAMDAEQYDMFALFLLDGNVTHKDFIYLNSLYPFFLALIYLVSYHSHIVVVIVQAVMDSASCLLIYYIAATQINRRVAILAALIYAAYGISIFYTGILLAPTVVIFLTLSCIALTIAAGIKRNAVLFFCSGIVLGAAVLGRSNLLFFIPFLALWLIFSGRKYWGGRFAFRGLFFLLAGCFLVLSLISMRNYAITREFTPFLLGGINFYIGNNPRATGSFMTPQGIATSPLEEIKSSVQHVERELGKDVSPAQASRYWFLKGLSFLKEHPYDAFALYVKKFALFWGNKEIPVDIDYTLSRTLVPLLQFPFFSFGMIAPLALLGMCLSFTDRRLQLMMLFVFSYMISVVIFFVTARYRLPVVPVLIIFSAYAVHWCAEMIGRREIKKLAIAGSVLVVCAAGINKGSGQPTPIAASRHFNNLGTVYLKRDLLPEAFAAVQKALELDPNYESARCNLGNVYLKQGLLEESIQAYTAVINSNPLHAEAYTLLGTAYVRKGRLEEAVTAHKKALAIRPDFAEAYANLGFCYVQQGNIEQAISTFEKALELNATLVEAQNNLGSAYLKKGRLNDAVSRYRKALVLRPDYIRGYTNLGFALHKKGELDNAIAAYQDALALDPLQATTHYRLGNVYAARGDSGQAIIHYKQALAIDPGYDAARYMLNHAYAVQGKPGGQQ